MRGLFVVLSVLLVVSFFRADDARHEPAPVKTHTVAQRCGAGDYGACRALMASNDPVSWSIACAQYPGLFASYERCQ